MYNFFFFKPIEKYNQDSVSILQGTLPHPIRSMEKGRVRSFSYAFFANRVEQSRAGQGKVQDRTG